MLSFRLLFATHFLLLFLAMSTSQNQERHSPVYWRKHPTVAVTRQSDNNEPEPTIAGWNNSDKLAVALFFLALAAAIILYLVEKTTLVVVLLLVLLVASLVYPVLHFFRRRIG